MASLSEIHDAANNLSTDDLQRLVKYLKHDLEERRKAPRTRSAEIDRSEVDGAAKKKSKGTIEVDHILNSSADDD